MIRVLQKIIPILVFALVFFSGTQVFAQATPTISSVPEGGNWDIPSTWIENRIPDITDTVEINGPVVIGNSKTILNLTLNPDSSINSTSSQGRILTVTEELYNIGTIGPKIGVVSSGDVINLGTLTTDLSLTGGNQNLVGDFDININLHGDVTTTPSVYIKKIQSQGFGLYFHDSSKTFRTENIDSDFITNGNIVFELRSEDTHTHNSGNITAPSITLTTLHKIVQNSQRTFTVDNFTVSENATLANMGNFGTVLTITGDIINNGTLERKVGIISDNSGDIINNGVWENALTLRGSGIRTIKGIFPEIYLEDDTTSTSSFRVKSIIGEYEMNFPDEDLTLTAEWTKSNFNSNGNLVYDLYPGSIDVFTRNDGNINARKITFSYDNHRIPNNSTRSYDTERLTINEGVTISTPSANFIGAMLIKGEVVNNGGTIIPRAYLQVYGSIENNEGLWDFHAALRWPTDPSNEYEFEIGNSPSNLERYTVYENILVSDPNDGKLIRDILNDGEVKFWRVRPVGGAWSEVFSINVPLGSDEPADEPDFFSISEIPDLNPEESVEITITALDEDYDGMIQIYVEQGSIMPRSILMEDGEATVTIDLHNSPVVNQITVSSGQNYGFSNIFTVGSEQFGSLVGDVRGDYSNVTVTFQNQENTYETTTNINGDFIFSDIVCGEYIANVSGQVLGVTLTSFNEKVDINCTGITNHTITTAVLENCNPEGPNKKIPVLLVPGILGSTTTNTIGVYPNLPATPPAWDSGGLKLHNVVLDFDFLENNDPRFDGVGWETLKENLEIQGYNRNCTIFDAPYYWADSSTDNSQDYLKNYVDHAKLVAGTERVDIIAHSMGGIVARSYIQSDEYENDVRKFAMVGTPNQGALSAYYIYDGADPLRADKNALMMNPGGIFNPNIFFYTNSLQNFYKKKTGLNACQFVSYTNGSGIDNFGYRIPIFCNRSFIKPFIENQVPGLRDLLPTYQSALIDNETDTFINYPTNINLNTLNNDSDKFRDTDAIIFTGDDKDTLENLVVGNPGDTFYPYGKPLYYQQVIGNGDGTVPTISANLPGLDNSSGNGDHGRLPQLRSEDIINFIQQ